MEFRRVWVLRGPNIWSRRPVLEIELQLQELHGTTSTQLPGFTERLTAWLPSLAENPAGTGFVEQLRRGTGLADMLQYLALHLQVLSGSAVTFGLVRDPAPETDVYRVVVAYEEEEVGRACVEAARDILFAAVHNTPLDVPARLQKLRDLAHDVCLGPSTAAIVRAARQRNIPVRRLSRASLVQLGYGSRQRRICTAETDRTSAIAEAVAKDKQLTRSLLQAVGVAVPDGQPVTNAEDAWATAQDIGLPVVVKPRDGNHGRGVTTNLRTREQVVRAYAAARAESDEVMVERFIVGDDYRLLVIGDRLIAAARREPAHVLGDGRSTILQLIEQVNRDPRRSDGHATVLSIIKLDEIAHAVLEEQGCTPSSVPPAGARVLIRRNANLSTGGTATDVTDEVHPDVAARAVDAARAVGLDIAGIDLVAKNVTQPLEEQGAAVVEVNAGPGLRMHLEPSAGSPRPVGEAIVSMLFPPPETGRIPIAAVTGVNGKTTTTRLLAHLLGQTGQTVGMSCTEGIYIAGRQIEKNNCSGPRSARTVLLNPRVDAAVLETARGGMLREGLGFDSCDVAVVTNIGQGDHLSPNGTRTPEELAEIKRIVVEAVSPTGAAVLNAADPLVVAMAGRCPGSVLWFSRTGELPLVVEHRKSGGRAVFVRDDLVILATGNREEVLTSLAQAPLTHHGRIAFQVENVLAASAAAWALGTSLDAIRAGLASFRGDAGQAPGRFNVLAVRDATVIVDYAHNTSALLAVVEAVSQLPHQRRSIVFTGCGRGDADHRGMGEIVGHGFDRVILCQAGNPDNPVLGKYDALLRQGLSAGKRVSEVLEATDERGAIDVALADLRPGDLVVLGVEAVEESLAYVCDRLAVSASPQTAACER